MIGVSSPFVFEQGLREGIDLARHHLGEGVGPLGERLVERDGALIDRGGELRRAIGKSLVHNCRRLSTVAASALVRS